VDAGRCRQGVRQQGQRTLTTGVETRGGSPHSRGLGVDVGAVTVVTGLVQDVLLGRTEPRVCRYRDLAAAVTLTTWLVSCITNAIT
jgi:hypothetical protein